MKYIFALRALLLSALACLLLASGRAAAQQAVTPPDSAAADSVRRISPGKAFYRSLLIPGWGQASVGAYVRGGTFFALQSASGYMLFKTIARLNDAERREGLFVRAAGDSLRALMRESPADSARLSDPVVFQAAVDSAGSVQRIRGLISARKEQRQDWITYTLVVTLASGVDAFVAAHLANFPVAVDATPRAGGGFDLRLRVPVGGGQR